MIALRDVVVRYPRATRDALAGVSLEAPRGALTAVAGPNGSGKSTLVRLVLGRVPLTAGQVTVDGEPLDRIGARALATRVAVVPQREEPTFAATASEYVALGRYPHVGDWRALGHDDREAVRSASDLAGITELLDRDIATLSGGEWQRVRLARALAQGGDAIVLDEPTTFLDVAHEMAVFELLHRLARSGRAVLLVSHQLNLVARFADRITLLHGGRVAAEGAPADVMRASVLEPVYEWPLVVTRDPAVGAPALVPLRSRSGS